MSKTQAHSTRPNQMLDEKSPSFQKADLVTESHVTGKISILAVL